ncbi:hypothetical protein WN943_018620 [Citrus x changshan-huyou]
MSACCGRWHHIACNMVAGNGSHRPPRKVEKSKKEASNKHRHETYNFYGFCYGVQLLTQMKLKQVLKKTSKENKEPYYQSVRRYCTMILTWVDEFKQFLEKEKYSDTTFPSDEHHRSLINGFRPYDSPKSFYEPEDLDTIESRSKNRYDYIVHKLNTFKVDVAEIKVEVAEIKMAMVEDRKVF